MVIIREIERKDDLIIEQIIKNCLMEFTTNKEGCAWSDPDLNRFSQIYNKSDMKYWVCEVDGIVVGGCGIGPLDETNKICELQKMYIKKEARNNGYSHLLIQNAISFAKRIYNGIYLETFENMTIAQSLYEKYGFEKTEETIGNTGHYLCNVHYIKYLNTTKIQ